MEGTSDEYFQEIRDHSNRKKREVADASVADATAKRRKLALAESFPARMQTAFDAMAQKGSQVGVCKMFLKMLKEDATSNGNQRRLVELQAITKLASPEMVAKAGEIFSAQASATAAVVVTAPAVSQVGDDDVALGLLLNISRAS
jgi:hypothetical protein